MLVLGRVVSRPRNNLLLLPCGKFVVSLTMLEFLLHTYIHGFLTCVQILQSEVQTYGRPGGHIHFACTDINQLFHTI